MDNKDLLNDCIEKIAVLFQYDTISLLDCVLTDDTIDPQFSAITTINRINATIEFEKLYYNRQIKNIDEWLCIKGYNQKILII